MLAIVRPRPSQYALCHASHSSLVYYVDGYEGEGHGCAWTMSGIKGESDTYYL